MINRQQIVSILNNKLRHPSAPRILDRATFADFVKEITGETMPPATLSRLINFYVVTGIFFKVQRDLYGNTLATPFPVIDEVAEHISPGCRISLQRALGAYGIANNPSNIITAVVPFAKGQKPKLGSVTVGGKQFRFHGITEAVFNAGDPEDLECKWNRPIPGNVMLASPEKALLDWIYLGNSRQSNMTLPPYGDIHLEDIDIERFQRLANAANMTEPAEAWLAKAHETQSHDWEDVADNMGIKF